MINFHAKGNSEDPFAVAVTKGELIVAWVAFQKKKNSAVCLVLLRVNSVSLGTTLYGNELSFLNLSGSEKKFSREQIFATWHSIAKIAKISASRKFPAIRYIQHHMYSKYACACLVCEKVVGPNLTSPTAC